MFEPPQYEMNQPQVYVPVLCLTAGRAAERCFQAPSVDPAYDRMEIDPKNLCEAIGRIEASVLLECHSSQLQMNRSHCPSVPGSLKLEVKPPIAHKGIARQNVEPASFRPDLWIVGGREHNECLTV